MYIVQGVQKLKYLLIYYVKCLHLNTKNIHYVQGVHCLIVVIYKCTMYTLYNIHCAGCPIVTTSTYILYKVFTSKYVKYILCTVCTSKYVLCTLCRVSNRYIFYLYIMYSVSNRYTIYTYTM